MWFKIRITVILLMGTLLVGAAMSYDLADEYAKYNQPISNKEVLQIYYNIVKATGQPEIYPPLTIDPSGTMNAYTTSKGITIFRGLIDQVHGNKDMIALVLAHEAAHFALGHVGRETAPTTEETRIMELQADHYGAYTMMHAGYNICEGRKLFLVFIKIDGDAMGLDHPDNAYRYEQLNTGCSEVI